MNEIKTDKKNYRKHPERNKELIQKSLRECGAGRSILLDNDNTIIAGNGVFEQAKELNIPVKIIETDGKELLAVKRTDINKDSEERTKLAILDNKTSDTSLFDLDLMQDDIDFDKLIDFGFEDIELGINNNYIAGQGEKEVDENIETENECPNCHYKW